MAIEVRACATRAEFVEALRGIDQYLGGAGPREEWLNDWLTIFEIERMHGAFADGRAVGGAGAFTFELSVPGGSAPAAGVTVVGVLPTHRRRGVLRSMMRTQLDDIRARGEPLAILWASEAAIYPRYGYGLASLQGQIDVPRERTAFAAEPPEGAGTRFVSADEALELFPPVYDRVRVSTPGMVARSAAWWKARRLADPEATRRGGAQQRVVLELDGRPEAYALYRLFMSFEAGSSSGYVSVIEAMGATPRAEAAIWHFLVNIDWVARIKAGFLPVDHPLLVLLAEPRRLRFTIGEALWIRLVDVEAALARRGYGDSDAVVLEVGDSFCTWNEGRYRIDGRGVTRTDDEPDLRLDVSALGSAYLGGFTFAQLARALRVEELRGAGIARADALFRSDRRPWCPEIF